MPSQDTFSTRSFRQHIDELPRRGSRPVPLGLWHLLDNFSDFEELFRFSERLPQLLPRVGTEGPCSEGLEAVGWFRLPEAGGEFCSSLPGGRNGSHFDQVIQVGERRWQVPCVHLVTGDVDGDGVPPLGVDLLFLFSSPRDGSGHGSGRESGKAKDGACSHVMPFGRRYCHDLCTVGKAPFRTRTGIKVRGTYGAGPHPQGRSLFASA
jgi:hypothetical protein